MILIIAAILGFISVAFGAYADHGLQGNITESQMHSIMTAVRYNQLYAILIATMGLFVINTENAPYKRAICMTGFLFSTGTVLFSFSIYLAILFNKPFLMNLAPLGGFTLMAAWLSLIYIVVLHERHNKN